MACKCNPTTSIEITEVLTKPNLTSSKGPDLLALSEASLPAGRYNRKFDKANILHIRKLQINPELKISLALDSKNQFCAEI